MPPTCPARGVLLPPPRSPNAPLKQGPTAPHPLAALCHNTPCPHISSFSPSPSPPLQLRSGPFDPGASPGQHSTGFTLGGVAWYSKEFETPKQV